MLTNPDDLKKDILAGHYDDHRDRVFGWFKARRKAVQEADLADIKADLRPGFKMITQKLSKESLNGHVVTVQEISQTRAWVTFDDPKATKYGSRRVKVPIICLKWFRE